jgi:hypothetical protein
VGALRVADDAVGDAHAAASSGRAGALVAGIVEGIRYARSRQELLGTYLVDINAMFFGMPMALFPALAQRYGGP